MEKKLILYLLLLIIIIFFNSFAYVLGKKALISQFLSPQKILLYTGIYQLLLTLLFTIPFFFVKLKISGKKENIFNIFSDKLNNFKSITFCILYMITECLYEYFLWIIIDRFLPNDLAIALIVKGLAAKIFDFGEEYFIKNTIKHLARSIIEFIIYIFLIIATSIHSEIIIINICGLNKYTKKSIRAMSYEDFKLCNLQATINMDYEEDEDEEEKLENQIIFELSKN